MTVVEVGPGPGGLTRALLAAGAQTRWSRSSATARCLPALAEIAAALSRAGSRSSRPTRSASTRGRCLTARPARIVANLPYNVGTALLTGWLAAEAWPPWWRSLTLMFQREVAERIVADERDRANYGRLGVLAGWRTQARILFDVPAAAFVPPPKVTSSVVLLTPRPDPPPCRVEALEAVTRAAFGQRRKMLRQSLKSLTSDAGALLAEAGIPETARAEEVPVAGYVRLANAFHRSRTEAAAK